MLYRRRPPGAAVGASTIYAKVSPAAAEVLDDLAIRLGVSKAEFVETALLHLGASLDERGAPPWWTKAIPDPQELPLTG
jgi:hypothetical protein